MSAKSAESNEQTPSNKETIAGLRRRGNRYRILLYSSLLLMPLGCGIPLSLLAVFPDSLKIYLGMAGLALPIIGLAGTLLMWGDQSATKRSLALAEQAESMELTYYEKPTKQFLDPLRSLKIFELASKTDARDMLTGQIDDTEITFMRYMHVIGYGRYSSRLLQTIAVFYDSAEGLPNFLFHPKSWLGFLDRWFSQIIGDTPYVDLTDEPDFCQQFDLRGENDEDIKTCFTPAVVSLCLAKKNMTVEVNNGLMVVFEFNKELAPREYPDFAAQAMALLLSLRAAKDLSRE